MGTSREIVTFILFLTKFPFIFNRYGKKVISSAFYYICYTGKLNHGNLKLHFKIKYLLNFEYFQNISDYYKLIHNIFRIFIVYKIRLHRLPNHRQLSKTI